MMTPWIITIALEILTLAGLVLALRKIRGLPQRLKFLGLQQLAEISPSGKTGKQLAALNLGLASAEQTMAQLASFSQWLHKIGPLVIPQPVYRHPAIKTATPVLKWLLPVVLKTIQKNASRS